MGSSRLVVATFVALCSSSVLAAEAGNRGVEACQLDRCETIELNDQLLGIKLRGLSQGQVWAVVEDILQVSGLEPNFEVHATDQVGNAAAAIIDEQRYLLYNINWMEREAKADREPWKLYGVMAHEIGHHLQGHTLDRQGSQPPTELEADSYAGFVMAGLGASLSQAQSLWRTLPARGSRTHPGRADRLDAIERGWQRWQRLQSKRSTTQRAPVQQREGKYLLSNSHRQKLSAGQLSGWDKQRLRLARNEIFARHGYRFNSGDLQRYFAAQSWYQATDYDVYLSDIERYNVQLIRSLERAANSTQAPVVKSSSTSSGYLMADSASRRLTRAELARFSRQQLRLMRNEIFARHGYVFNSQDLQSYFARQSWYSPRGKQVNLSALERDNVALIKSVEQQ